MKKINKDNDLNVHEYPVIENVIYCFKATAEHYPLMLLWCVIAVILNVLSPLLATYMPKAVIDEIMHGNSVNNLTIIVLAFGFGIAVILGLKRFFERIIYFHKFKMNTFYTRKVAVKGMTTDYCNQEKEHFRKLQSESFNSCNGNRSHMTQVYDTGIALLSNILGFAVYFGILAKLSIFVVLLITVTTFISYSLNKRVIKWASDNNKEKIGYGQKTNYINNISGDIKSAKDIRLYNMPLWLENVYMNNIKGLSNWYKRYTSKILKAAVTDSLLSLLRESAAYAYLLYLVLKGQLGIADFVLYFAVITGFQLWLGGILGQINSLNRISLAVNYLRAFLEYPEIFKRLGGIDTANMLTSPKKIELINVSYRYEGASEDTLKNISLVINSAEHLAVIGLNGAGKTTLVKLICGLCDPTEGVILYDGVDIREFNRVEYYKLFSAVFQQCSVLPVTIEEIVAESLSVDTQRAEGCLRLAGLWDKITVLPKGIKSNFGKTVYDDGVELSGGEMQKLLLARALYKNAPVVILDEPTAALDPISESRLYQIYNTLMVDKSAVFISHRLASTRFCHRILLIENGSICEEGTHDSLMKQKSKYYGLFETQSKYYRDSPFSGEGLYE